MIFIVSCLVLAFSTFVAYHLMKVIKKKKLSVLAIILLNFVNLLVFAILTVVSGLDETSLLLLISLLGFTIFGILKRIFSPIILNFVGCILSKITKCEYKRLTHYEMMEEPFTGTDIYLFDLSLITIKVVLCIMLILSFVRII